MMTAYNPQEPKTLTRFVKGTKVGVTDYRVKRAQLGLRKGYLPAVAKHFDIALVPGEQYEENTGHDCPEPLYKAGQTFEGTNGVFKCARVIQCSCGHHNGLRAVLVKLAPRRKRKAEAKVQSKHKSRRKAYNARASSTTSKP